MSAEPAIDWQETGRKLFAGECRFIVGATSMEVIPPLSLPEIAFIGRSNVGKSTLVNGLTGRKTLARTSSHPGHTRQLNFFNLNERCLLVDLPGYGFAKASKTEKKSWNDLIRNYLRGRVNLRRVLLLIDSRHGVKPNDKEMMDYLDDMAVPYQILLTKTDKSGPTLAATIAETEEVLRKHAGAISTVMSTSAEKGTGIPELRALLAELISY